MASSSSHEGPPLHKSHADALLQQLLDRQLSTTARLELVDFKEATESMRCIGHASAGVASLAEFQEHSLRQREADEKAWALHDLLQSKGLSDSEIKDHFHKIGGAENASSPLGLADKVAKRKRFGAHPDFLQGVEAEQKHLVELGQRSDNNVVRVNQKQGRHAEVLEASLLHKSDRPSAEMIMGGRKPLLNMEQRELYRGITPQERARLAEEDGPRSVAEVFANPAPPVLDMYTYLEQRQHGASLTSPESPSLVKNRNKFSSEASECRAQYLSGEKRTDGAVEESVREVPDEEIKANRLSEEEICMLPGGKFADYAPGCPSHTVYIKNLMPGVTEADLVGIFIRFEKSGGPKLVFRLMQSGRMKDQAFVTFADNKTAGEALKLANGYILKGKPMVIEFARGASCPASVSSNMTPKRLRRRKAVKEKHIT